VAAESLSDFKFTMCSFALPLRCMLMSRGVAKALFDGELVGVGNALVCSSSFGVGMDGPPMRLTAVLVSFGSPLDGMLGVFRGYRPLGREFAFPLNQFLVPLDQFLMPFKYLLGAFAP
jgi:hypothetical protein